MPDHFKDLKGIEIKQRPDGFICFGYFGNDSFVETRPLTLKAAIGCATELITRIHKELMEGKDGF